MYQSIVNYCRIIDLNQDRIYEDTYLGIRSPNNKMNEMTVDPSYQIFPVQNGYDSYGIYSNYFFLTGMDGSRNQLVDYDLKIKTGKDYSGVEIKITRLLTYLCFI